VPAAGFGRPAHGRALWSFEAAFREHGLPEVIRSDNGTPFASTAPGGLSRLSVWWIHLGIRPERITPGKPAENGRHGACTGRSRRRRRNQRGPIFGRSNGSSTPSRASTTTTDRTVRLAIRRQLSITPRPPRPYPRRLPEIHYSQQHLLRLVSSSGHIRWYGHSFFISEALHREVVGVLPVSDDVAEVYFGPILLGTLCHRRPDLGLVRPEAKRPSGRSPV
jgi:putative transposase